jgi:curved DNA-binding protein CbpA
MSRFASQNYYQILDLEPGADTQQIREAFREAQRSFDPSSPALHSLYDPDEAAAINHKLVEAFEILANPERRTRYDRYLSHLKGGVRANTVEGFFNEAHRANDAETPRPTPLLKAVGGGQPEGPQATVRALRPAAEPEPEPEPVSETHADSPRIRPSSGEVPAPSRVARPRAKSNPSVRRLVARPLPEKDLDDLFDEHGCSGALIRRVRERLGVSLEDVSNVTKINILYLRLIEAEDHDELPARVYLRGFLRQIAQLLKLPVRRFVDGYFERMDNG